MSVALNLLRLFADHGLGMSQAQAFCFIVQNPGVGTRAIADGCRMTEATASRAARALLSPGDKLGLAPHLGLLARGRAMGRTPDYRRARFTLTQKGALMRSEIEAVIRAGDAS